MESYGGNKMSVVSPIYPVLALSTIGATVRSKGHNVEIFDLSWQLYDYEILRKKIIDFQPDIIGITALTPLANQLFDMSILIKDISKEIIIVAGGPHPSSLPEETIKQSLVDAVVVGEGDYTFTEICDGWDFKDIKGPYTNKVNTLLFPVGMVGDGQTIAFVQLQGKEAKTSEWAEEAPRQARTSGC